MNSAWDLGERTWKELIPKTWAEILEDDVFGRAAQLSYYFLLALFPLMLFLLALLGYFAGAGAQLRQNLGHALSSMLPAAFVSTCNSSTPTARLTDRWVRSLS